MVADLIMSNDNQAVSQHGSFVDCTGNPLSVHVTAWIAKDNMGNPQFLIATIVPLQVEPKEPNKVHVSVADTDIAKYPHRFPPNIADAEVIEDDDKSNNIIVANVAHMLK